MSLLKIHSRSKPFGRKPFYVFSLVYRCVLCVMMTRLIYQRTNSVLEVSANPCPAQFTEQIQMHQHAHLSVCLQNKNKPSRSGALRFTTKQPDVHRYSVRFKSPPVGAQQPSLLYSIQLPKRTTKTAPKAGKKP
jgi:hypothetical protein